MKLFKNLPPGFSNGVFNTKKEKKKISTIWIVLSFLLFLPFVGVLLLGIRFMQNKKDMARSGKIMRGIGIAFSILFLIALTTSELSDFTAFILIIVFFGLTGVICFLFAFTMFEKSKLQEKYKTAVEEHKLTNLRDISETMELPLDTVIEDLKQMITGGIFPEASIDTTKEVFILRSYIPQGQQERKTMKCNSCGAAVTAVQGMDSVCEYCGSQVSYR